MSATGTYELVVLIVVCLAGAAYLYVKHRKAASTAAATTLDAAVNDLKNHVEATVASAAESIKTRVATVGAATVSKITGQPVGVPIIGTANAPAPAPVAQPAASPPAAPAPSVAAEPPPTTVVPAAPPAAPAPSAGGSGTTPAPDPAAHASDQFYAAALAARAAQQQNEAYNGPIPAASLQEADWRFLWWATINPATPKMHNWEYTVLSGTRAEIQQGLAHIGNDVARMRGYDATKYTGVLRSHYDEAVKA